MKDYKLFYELNSAANDYFEFSKLIKKHIDAVKEHIPGELLLILKKYDISYLEYNNKFFDFDNEIYYTDELGMFINNFCIYIETIQLMTGISVHQK